MKQTRLLLIALMIVFLTLSCSKPTEHAGKWRVIDKYDYPLTVDAQTLFSDIDEVEKILLMPVSYLEQNSTPISFDQAITYTFEKEEGGKKDSYSMHEQTTGSSDGTGAFHVLYGNDKNEGWEMIWKDNFLYRKLLGGEFSRTFSMGEHEFFREAQFKMMPEIYTVFRDHAKISGSQKTTVNGQSCRELTLEFVSQKQNRSPLPTKQYLQNSAGVDELKNDKLISSLSQKKFSNINGTFAVCIQDNFTPSRLVMHLSFSVPAEKITITIDGERTVQQKAVDAIAIPDYISEYHRRTMDATKNIMK